MNQWNSLSPEEKNYRKLQLENESLKKNQAKAQQSQASDKSFREVEAKVHKIQQDYGLSNEAFFGLYQELVKKGVKESDITPERVAHYADEKAVTNYVSGKVKEIAPNFEGLEALTEELVNELSTNHALDINDIDDIIKSITQEEVDSQIEEKLKTKKRSTGARNPNSDPISFDEAFG
jgi:hypothetical protein